MRRRLMTARRDVCRDCSTSEEHGWTEVRPSHSPPANVAPCVTTHTTRATGTEAADFAGAEKYVVYFHKPSRSTDLDFLRLPENPVRFEAFHLPGWRPSVGAHARVSAGSS